METKLNELFQPMTLQLNKLMSCLISPFPILGPSDCYTDPYATDYRGTINVTRSGYTCQAWTSQYPHEHSRTPLEYPNTGIGEHNYCRNPDTSGMAWCYTTDTNVRWEYCSIGIPQEVQDDYIIFICSMNY